ncbi:MAG TPA: SAM-dependent methyltransferase [Pseudonocardia sp.]|nr:SAM-dependent methyltransferase [Pseudonocardia sp.]
MPDQRRAPQRPPVEEKIRLDIPQSARIWNYWMGGKDYYPIDREAGDAVIAVNPGIVTVAKQSRRFLIRTVSTLAGELGIRQFLDIGTGLPTMQNTHEVAQGIAPDARIVYVDNDPLVLTHARALLTNTTPEGVTGYVDADIHDPDLVVSDARNILNFNQPIAVMFMGILGHVPEFEHMRWIINSVMDAVPSGSYLLLWDSTSTSEEVIRGREMQERTNIPYELRTIEELAQCFEGLEMVEPGLVSISQWRPDILGVDGETLGPIDAYGGMGRKP